MLQRIIFVKTLHSNFLFPTGLKDRICTKKENYQHCLGTLLKYSLFILRELCDMLKYSFAVPSQFYDKIFHLRWDFTCRENNEAISGFKYVCLTIYQIDQFVFLLYQPSSVRCCKMMGAYQCISKLRFFRGGILLCALLAQS